MLRFELVRSALDTPRPAMDGQRSVAGSGTAPGTGPHLPPPLADAKDAITWDLSVDSTACRAHRYAAGARKQGDLQKEPPGGVFDELRDQELGRSRGGFTTKLHLAVEQGQTPMSVRGHGRTAR